MQILHNLRTYSHGSSVKSFVSTSFPLIPYILFIIPVFPSVATPLLSNPHPQLPPLPLNLPPPSSYILVSVHMYIENDVILYEVKKSCAVCPAAQWRVKYVSLLLGCCPPKTNISFFLSGWGLPYQTRQTATMLNKNKNGSFIPVLWSRPVKKINLNLQFIL